MISPFHIYYNLHVTVIIIGKAKNCEYLYLFHNFKLKIIKLQLYIIFTRGERNKCP
jgi:hypothetical protein